ncbi:Glycine-rich cell wall structural protein 1.8 precursor (GRP 1.8) [Streptomyces venezuelae]|nr:Glycine-rich cell wall structural protein 1.8 precursor (GRP 1.8) [Streptomyces venezuelae]
MGQQGVARAERTALAHGVEEEEHGLLDAALPGHRHPVAALAHGRLTLVVDDVGQVEDLALGVLARDLQDLLGRAVQPVHHADGGEAVAGELEHDVVHEPLADPGAHVDVLDVPGDEEAQGVDDVDEVVEDEGAGVLGQADPVLLQQDQLARVVGALRVGGREAPVEADEETDRTLLGELHEPLGVRVLVGEGLVDVRGDARFEESAGDLGVGGGGRVDEGRVESGGDQRVEVAVALRGGQVEGVGDPVQGRGGTGLEVELDPGEGGEDGEVRLLCDVAESDAANLHGVSLVVSFVSLVSIGRARAGRSAPVSLRGPGRGHRRPPVGDAVEAAQDEARAEAGDRSDERGAQGDGRPGGEQGDRSGAGGLADDGGGARQAVGGVGGERAGGVESGPGAGVVGEDDGVLDGLVPALSEARHHRVRGVAEEGDPAPVEGGQRVGQVVDVVAQDLAGVDGGEDLGDGVVPVAEEPQEFGPLVVGRAAAGGGGGHGVRVDPAVLEGLGAPEASGAPGLVGGEGPGGGGDDDPPGGAAGVARAGVFGEERVADRGADAVGGDDEFGLDLAFRGGQPGGAVVVAGVGERGGRSGADGALGQGRGEDLDEGGAVEEDERPAEARGGGLGVRPGEPAAVGGAHAAVALPGGEFADAVAETDDVQGSLGVGGEADARADGGEVGGALQDGDLPAVAVKGDGGGEPADSGSDDDGTALFHGCSPGHTTTDVVTPTSRPYYRCSQSGSGR